MSTNKNIDKICAVIIALTLVLTLLFMNGEALGITKIVDEDAESYEGDTYFTENDMNGAWDSANATLIRLDGDSASVSGSGAYAADSVVTIAQAGYYSVSGSLSDGKIVVDAESGSKVWLLLDGTDIYCSDDAALRVDQADKVFLTLAEGSVNRLESGASYSEEALSDNTGGVIFAHDDLTINGSGSLDIKANYKFGIDANDDFVVTGGSITIDAPDDAVHANDSIRIMEADITIDSGDDALHSDGFVLIDSGSVLINSCNEGIEAPHIDINGGDTTIYPTDDGINANGGSSSMGGSGGFGGGFGGGTRGGSGGFGGTQSNTESTEESASVPSEQQSAVGEQQPSGGEQPSTGGEQQPSAGQADSAQTDIVQTAFSGTAESTQPSTEASNESEESSYFRMTGGSLTIVSKDGRDADGIDSNGSIYIEGGTIRVSMNSSGGSYALDYGSESGGVCEISGGNIIGAGSYGMAEAFDSSSTQPSILYTYSAGAEAGTEVALEDASGNVLISYEVPCAFNALNISCPEMEIGGTYIVVIGDNVEEITLEEVSASYGDAQSSGFGGTMNFGGMSRRGGFGGMMMFGSSDSDSSSESGDSEAQEGVLGPLFEAGSEAEGATAEQAESSEGERPSRGFGGGMPPDFSGGTPPDFDGETPPDFSGEMPDGMQGFPGGMQGGGGRGMRNRPDGATPPDGTQDGATPPDGTQDGATAPDGTQDGATPPDGTQDATTAPDGTQDATTSPDEAEGSSPGGRGQGFPDSEQSSESADSDAQASESGYTLLSDVDTSIWIWLAASAAALIFGLIFAKLFRRR